MTLDPSVIRALALARRRAGSGAWIALLIALASLTLAPPTRAASLDAMASVRTELWPYWHSLSPTADGRTVIGSYETFRPPNGPREFHSYLWTREGGRQDITALGPNVPDGFSPRDLSGDGSRALGFDASGPVIWDRDMGLLPLASAPGLTSPTPRALSNDGRYVVGEALDGGTYTFVSCAGGPCTEIERPSYVPVLWDADGTQITALSDRRGTAVDVSDDRTVIGQFDDFYADIVPGLSPQEIGFRWDDTQDIQFIPLPVADRFISNASEGPSAISADGGSIVGQTIAALPTLTQRQIDPVGYVWSGDPAMGEPLPPSDDGLPLPGEILPLSGMTILAPDAPDSGTSPPLLYTEISALGISADGSTVVGTYYSELFFPRDRAFIWTEEDGFRDLEVLLQALGIDTSDWILREATGVSADGRTIFGTGYQDVPRSGSSNPRRYAVQWVAVIPEPSTALLLGLGLLGLARTSPRRDA
jgi:hypothetical protein